MEPLIIPPSSRLTMRIEFNAWNSTVTLWCGEAIIDSMTITEYQTAFGLEASRLLLRTA